ncbi:MAG TPA: hypothetical protein VL832_04235 [Puia sp.]|nr:hypothetical protein [Puia sp.]
MGKHLFLCLMASAWLVVAHAQSEVKQTIVDLPSRLLTKIQHKTSDLDAQLTQQSRHYLDKMVRREDRLRKKMYKVDSNAANTLFAGSSEKYAALTQQLSTDTGSRHRTSSGEYKPYTDSLQQMLSFLQQQPIDQTVAGTGAAQKLSAISGASPKLQKTIGQLQTLQAKMQDADQVKEYMRQRKQQIANYIQQHENLSTLFGKDYQGMNQDIYYYSQQVRQYKDMLNNPDKLERQALSLLNKLPAFQSFMKQNSQLAGLFSLPENYGSPVSLAGLQTRDQVGALVQNQVAAGGAGGAAVLQGNLQSAESQLDDYKDKLSKLGGGSGDIDMPDFKPNDQKTKTFWKRLEYGTNFQTTRNNYLFPTVSDLGLSVGYKLNNNSTIGVGASYKLGWGNGIQHIALSSQGAGLRSFIDIRIKGSFAATGGLEYNYTTPFTAYQQISQLKYWTQSGLIGISKTVSMKSHLFKKTSLQLLWDFLSYQQIPKTQPLLFRVGYNF